MHPPNSLDYSYNTCSRIAKTMKDNPDVHSSRAAKIIRKYQELHPYNISQKSQIIVETFRDTTRHKIGGRGKMMVITSSRLAAVRYYHEMKRYIEEKKYDDVDKKLKNVKAVQTLSRLNRTCEGKTDTFVLDFVNKAEDIKDAFQPFFQETFLQEEVNADLLYQTQRELRAYGIYSDEDIEAFTNEYYKKGRQDDRAMGRMSSILLPVSNRYNKTAQNEKYQFRRQVRNLIKWYSYISQILRMFDKELQKEYVFCSYLIDLLPKDPVELIDLEGKLKLEYYKLQKTFQGEIALDEAKTVYVPAKHKGVKGIKLFCRH